MIKLRRRLRYKYDKDDKGAKAGIPPFRKEYLTLAQAKTARRYN